MADSRIKDGNYYVVQSFMVKELGLKGLEKEVYAIIYGFSQAENQKFDGSLQYLADWTLSTKQGIMKVLKCLQEKGLINKEEEYKNGVKFVKYYTTEFNTPSKLSLTNNIDNNIVIKESKKESNYDTIINSQITNEELKTTLYEFIKMRKLIKKPMTDRALQLLIGKLHKLANTPHKAIQVLEQSIVNNWQDIYELKTNYSKQKDNNKQAKKVEYTKEELDSLFDDISEVEI